MRPHDWEDPHLGWKAHQGYKLFHDPARSGKLLQSGNLSKTGEEEVKILKATCEAPGFNPICSGLDRKLIGTGKQKPFGHQLPHQKPHTGLDAGRKNTCPTWRIRNLNFPDNFFDRL